MTTPPIVLAHGVGRVYELPLPLWLYLLAAAATVVASFFIRGFARGAHRRQPRRIAGPGAAQLLPTILKVVGVAGLLLAIAAGLAVPQRGLTLAPLLFWVGLIVGNVTLSAVLGRSWRHADPWNTLEDVYRIEDASVSVLRPPWWLGPLLVYGLFWFELVSGVGFDAVWIVAVLIGYSLYSFSFRRSFGEDWRYADPLSILFGFAARIAPARIDDDGLYYTGSLAGLDEEGPMPLALFGSIFVLLASTSLDNLRETVGWSNFLIDTKLDELPRMLVDSVALLTFAGVFLAPFLVSVAVASRWLGRSRDFWTTARIFGWSLVPIGVAYVLAHNAPLLITGVPEMIRLLSDPFDKGWNLFGTRDAFGRFFASPRLVWFLEIGLIVGGHILGVLAAHRTALRIGESRAAAMKSQYALTALMSVFTITTLWLLAQPLVT